MSDAHPALDFDQDQLRTIEKIDLPAMRRLNALRILDAVRRHGPISRASLARRSGLSPPAVSALVDDLIDRWGLLREIGQDVSTGGRRPTLVKFAEDYGCVVGLDLGSTAIRYALADLSGTVIARTEEPIDHPIPDRLVEQMAAGIRRLLPEGERRPPLLAIGIGAPGMTDVEKGIVIEAANLRGWTGVPLRDLMACRFGVPVAVDNDVNMAVLGEYWLGCAQGQANFVFVALGRGVGAGIMIDGRLHRGSQWYAGEISHLLLDYKRWRRNFGAQGYLEQQVGAKAIERNWRRASRRARTTEPDLAALFSAARRGAPAASRVVNDVAVMLGVAIANLATTLDPALVVFGGGVGRVGEQLLEPVRKVVSRIVPNQPVIKVTALDGHAQLLGSVLSALRFANRALSDALLAGNPARPPRRAAARRSRSR
jgi:glucokinase